MTEIAPTLENAFGETLHVRVGIATGIVVVGDIIGSGESRERDVVGDTPNLAARLQGIAKPDSVVIAEATRRLIGDLFQLNDLGTQELKGIAAETRAFEVVRARSVESRFKAMRGALTPLVGRDEEIKLLLHLWGKAKDGEGQVVLLSNVVLQVVQFQLPGFEKLDQLEIPFANRPRRRCAPLVFTGAQISREMPVERPRRRRR